MDITSLLQAISAFHVKGPGEWTLLKKSTYVLFAAIEHKTDMAWSNVVDTKLVGLFFDFFG